MKRSEKSPLGYYTVGIAALFLAGFLLLVVFGAHSFRDTVAEQDGNMRTRAILSYLSACVKSCDTEDAVSLGGSPEEPVLVVRDGDSGYALRIYCRGGRLLEDFAAVDSDLDPDNAQIIGSTEVFVVNELPGDVLAVDTDEGRVLLHLRSGKGGAA